MLQIDLNAVLSSLVAGELARSRNCSELEASSLELTPATEIGERDLGLDSLGLLQLASAVSRMFHLHETGVDEYLLRYRTLGDWAEIVSVSLKKKAERITFTTSGSSGKPKPCVHHLADLAQEVNVHAESYRQCRRVVSLVPRHHIYGFLWTVMLPVELAVDVLDARWFTPGRLADQLREGDLLVGTPAIWKHISDSIGVFPASIFAVTSGAPCPAELFLQLNSQNLSLIEIYGSSETAGIGRRKAPVEPFELLPFWKRLSSPTMLARHSSSNGDLTEVQIPDHLNWLTDSRFFVSGRMDHAVQILGTNVFPERVAEVIRSHASVKACAVRLMQPAEGRHLKAFIVPGESAPADQLHRELTDWLRNKLQPHERPASLVFGPELPRNEMGKLQDWNC